MPSDAADAVEPALGDMCDIAVAHVPRAGCFQSDLPDVLINMLIAASTVLNDATHVIRADIQSFSEGSRNDSPTVTRMPDDKFVVSSSGAELVSHVSGMLS